MNRATPPKRGPWLAWLALVVGVAAIGFEIVSAVSTQIATVANVAMLVGLLIVAGAFLVSGVLIATRRPGNIVGWLLILPGLAVPIGTLASDWIAALDPAPTAATPAIWLGLVISGSYWLALIFPIFHLLLTFPEGRLLTRRWRWLVAFEVDMVLFFLFLAAFSAELNYSDTQGNTVWSVTNPIGFIGYETWAAIMPAWTVGLLVLTIGGVIAFALRFRRGSPETRHQLKWPMAAIGLFGIAYGLTTAQSGAQGLFFGVLFFIALAAIPVSVVLAVLRYHLYEIDRVISRTVSWAIVTGVLVVTFGTLVVGLQGALDGVTQGQTLAVAGSTLVAAALFNPVRQRVQRAVDRRFNRSKYDAERIVSAFSEQLRNEVDLATLSAELHATTTRAVEPVTTAIWLRGRGVA